jgi:predicted small secreted protein
MRSAVRRPVGRTRRVLAVGALLVMPLAMTACSEDEGVGEDGGIVEEEGGGGEEEEE